MQIKLKCTSCGFSGVISDRHAGKKTMCPTCKAPIVIPALPSPLKQEYPNPGDDEGSSFDVSLVD